MKVFLFCLLLLVFAGNLAAQCPGNGYTDSTEMVTNGDFSNGDNDFSSNYTYCNSSGCLGFTAGLYTVGKDASYYSMYLKGTDHTSGTSNFLIGNANASSSGSTNAVWCQKIKVKPRTNYTLSVWVSNTYSFAFYMPSLQFAANGSKLGSAFNVPSGNGTWEKHEITWYSANNNIVDFCIYASGSTAFFGGSFGIDDISIRECFCNYPAEAIKDTLICEGESATLGVSEGLAYLWTPANTLSCTNCRNPVASPKLSSSYTVTVTDTSTCISSATVRVAVNPLPKADIRGDSILCNGGAGFLEATLPGATYHWNTGSTDSAIFINKPGIYWADVATNGCYVRDSFTVKAVNSFFDLGKDTALCEGESLELDITLPVDSVMWQDSSGNTTFTVTESGKYWAIVTKNTCIYSDTIYVTFKPNPVVDLGDDISFCQGETVTLDAGISGATYIWSNGANTQQTNVNTAGKYWLRLTQNGCTASDTIQVHFQAPISVNLGVDTILCEGETLKLNAMNQMWNNPVFLWQDSTTQAEFTVTKAGKYWVYIQSDACYTSDTINVNYKPLPIVNLGEDITVCDGEKVVLDAGIFADSYIWNTGDTTKTISVEKNGIYTLEAKTNGCKASDTIKVKFLPLPVFSIGEDTTLCEGQTLLLHADIDSVTYLWQDGFISPYSTVTKAGTYWVKVDNGNCIYTDTIHVKYYAYPEVNLGKDTILCPGQQLVLSAAVADAKYTWSNGSDSSEIVINKAGKYWAEAALGNCTGSDTIMVYYFDSPAVHLGSDTTLCGLRSWRLDAGSPGAQYLWSTGEKTRSITVSKNGDYWAQATYCGITVSDTVSIGFLNYSPEQLLVPNAFTPNGDFLNDTLNIIGIEAPESFEWRIFNRWGELVYQTSEITKGWDGTYKGASSPDGLYHWELSLRSACLEEKELARTGRVQLIR